MGVWASSASDFRSRGIWATAISRAKAVALARFSGALRTTPVFIGALGGFLLFRCAIWARCSNSSVLLRTLVLCGLLATNVSQAVELVAPSSAANAEGEGSTLAFTGELRTQTIYNANNFIGAMPKGASITAIAYRLDGPQGVPFDVSTTMTIRMSTTSSTAPYFSLLWDQNVGSDVQTVFSGAVRLIGDVSATRPNPFSVVIPLQNPFAYDPRAGNLLIDTSYQRATGGPGVVLDTTGDRSIASNIGPLPTVASYRDSGLVLQLTFTAVAEPSTLALLGVAALVFGARPFVGRRAL